MQNLTILKPFKLFDLNLKNRIVMTAMTRNFADKNHVPTNLMREYYTLRAKNGIGMILTEGTIIHPSGDGYLSVPYIYTNAQIKGWQKITSSVHKFKTGIFCQLWHCGRISHPDYLGGAIPVSSSAVRPEGVTSRTKKPFVTPRALKLNEIPQIIKMFSKAAQNALSAEFDGVEIHGGHGYLLDQFLDSRINQRHDAYGGSIENRCRLLLEVVKAVLDVTGTDKTILRISPSREMKGIIYNWPNLEEMIRYLIPKLDQAGLRILDISCARSDFFEIYKKTSGRVIHMVRPLWKHKILGGSSLPPEKAENEVKKGMLDLVTYGRMIIANPDFIAKISQGKKLVPYSKDMLDNLV